MADRLLALGMIETKGLVGSIEAADAMVRFKEKYEPDMKNHQEYEKPYQRYLRLYQNLKKQMSDDQEE